MRQSYPSDIK